MLAFDGFGAQKLELQGEFGREGVYGRLGGCELGNDPRADSESSWATMPRRHCRRGAAQTWVATRNARTS